MAGPAPVAGTGASAASQEAVEVITLRFYKVTTIVVGKERSCSNFIQSDTREI